MVKDAAVRLQLSACAPAASAGLSRESVGRPTRRGRRRRSEFELSSKVSFVFWKCCCTCPDWTLEERWSGCSILSEILSPSEERGPAGCGGGSGGGRDPSNTIKAFLEIRARLLTLFSNDCRHRGFFSYLTRSENTLEGYD